MPVAESEKRIDLHFFRIHESIPDFLRYERFGHFRFDGSRTFIKGQRLLVGQFHPQEIERHDDAVVARLDSGHRTDVEIVEDVAEARMHARLVVKRPDGSMHSGKPYIGRDGDVPAIVGWTRSFRLRSCRGLILSQGSWHMN